MKMRDTMNENQQKNTLHNWPRFICWNYRNQNIKHLLLKMIKERIEYISKKYEAMKI